MNDDVNNPAHYNVNGIEVIDVIETYAKDDFRLANVIKYVCRSGYKGKKLEDLKKARWYLNRVIEEMEGAEEAWRDIADRIEALEDTVPWEQVKDDTGLIARGYTEDEDPELFALVREEMEEARNKPIDPSKFYTTVVPSPDRIAGDTEAAKDIKADYYDFDKHKIYGYCVACDIELRYDQPFVRMHRDGLTLNFCGTGCMDAYDLEEGP
jgi:hypothetical protein